VADLHLTTSDKNVEIVIQSGAISHIGEYIAQHGIPPVVLLCTDANVAAHHAQPVEHTLKRSGISCHRYTLSPGDGSKSLDQLKALYDTMAGVSLRRDGMVLALGGGMVSDLAGLAAATWMRGVRFLICPTTVESAVDAAVGGKTAINHAAGKNMIGTFYHPQRVVIDPDALSTLPARDVRAGLAESIKHALIRDPSFLDWQMDSAAAILALDSSVLEELIARNLRIKIGVVESDEREHGQRAVLNFGHTIGHAVEQHFEYQLRHGEAVALGMLAATRISRSMGLLGDEDEQRIQRALRSFELPVALPGRVEPARIARLTETDKKVLGDRRRWVLLDGIGRTDIRDDIATGAIRDAIESLNPV